VNTVLYIAVPILAALLCVFTLVQLLYTESLRLLARDLPILEFFRETLQERLRLKPEKGILTFALIKHTLLLLLALCFLAMRLEDRTPPWQSLAEAALLAWLTMLVSTYALPQLIYRKTSGHWMLVLVPFLRICAVVFAPFTSIIGFFNSLIELGEPGVPADEKNGKAAEHIEAIISAGEEEGLIQEDERKLIESVVAFGDKTVREVMTPRPSIVAIGASSSLEDLREVAIHEQYSRLPVFENSIDQIVGFVHVRDMFELSEDDRKRRKVSELVRPIRYVPETKPVNDLLREMQQDGAHMVIVIDEYGNTAGLATMEDLVEEILGEIHDEHEPERDVQEESDGRYVVAGSLDVDRLQDLLDFRPQDETESTTVGGLVTEWLGRVPRVGEIVEREGLRIEVLDGNDLRINQVRLSKAEQKTPV
jgi:CBS domain containing-hemolysin-like protein